MKALLTDLGCDVVIDGGPSMNTSTEEFLEAFASVNADCIVVLPDNKNTVPAAKQAKLMYAGDAQVTVLKTRSMIEAYYALAMDVRDSNDVEYRVNQMKTGIEDTHTLSVAVASKDYVLNGLVIHAGDPIALVAGAIACTAPDTVSAVTEGLRLLPDIDEASGLMVVRGADESDGDADRLAEALAEAFPDLEVNLIDGGQHVIHWLVGPL